MTSGGVMANVDEIVVRQGRWPVVLCLLLVFVLTWAVWIPRAAGVPVGIVGQLWTWMPAAAAVVAATVTGGSTALHHLGSRLVIFGGTQLAPSRWGPAGHRSA